MRKKTWWNTFIVITCTKLFVFFCLCYSAYGVEGFPLSVKEEAFNKVYGMLSSCIIPYSHFRIDGNEEETKISESKDKAGIVQGREVFLTFDDGPSSNNTLKILNILNQNGIKATFFVTGKQAETYPAILKRVSDEGMCILPHTYSHEYKIYKSIEAYMDDMVKCREVIKNITSNPPSLFVRMPGGSDNRITTKQNLQNIKSLLHEKGIRYVDWNVSAADTASTTVPVFTIRKNVINQCRHKKIAVVLMHDSYFKTTSVEALPDIIRFLKSQGYFFRTFQDLSPNEEITLKKYEVIDRGEK